MEAVQTCRDCGESFPFDPDADRCPACVRVTLGLGVDDPYEVLDDDVTVAYDAPAENRLYDTLGEGIGPRCVNCGMVAEHHSAIDGACSDSDGPHIDAETEA